MLRILPLEPSLQILEHHRNQAHMRDLVADEGVAHEFRTQSPQMHDAGSANKRTDKTNHEINGVVGRQNAEVAHTRPEGVPRDQCLALLQVIFVGKHTSLGPAASPRGIDDAGHILTLPRHKHGITLAAKIFPALRPCKISTRRRLGHQHGLHFVVLELRQLHEGAPEVVFDDQKLCFAVCQQFRCSAAVIFQSRNQHATAEEDGVGRNQPFRLVAQR